MRSHYTSLFDISESKRLILIQRFWVKVSRTDSCWLWTGTMAWGGYGHMRGRYLPEIVCLFASHRLSWEIHRGPIADDLWVLHDCPGGDNPACVNPDHLWLGNHADNMADAFAKGSCSSPTKRNPAIAPRGEQHGRAKLTVEKVVEIRKLLLAGATCPEIAAIIGISESAIRHVKKGRVWAWLK